MEQVILMEKATHGQARNKLWFCQREGRITAYNFKAAVHTSQSMPATSLIKRICYSEAFKSTTESTRYIIVIKCGTCIMVYLYRWGCSHEKEALQAYTCKQSPHLTNLTIEDVGIFISMERPYIGASLDAIVSCDCCGKGTVEIKQ